jgi:hypothetical protein
MKYLDIKINPVFIPGAPGALRPRAPCAAGH